MRIGAEHVAVTVPATAGNLGPGFDTLGMALPVVDEIEVRALASNETHVAVEGEGAGALPSDGTHLVARAVHAALEHVGASTMGLRITCHNRIPHSRGLGSSAAAVVAGIAAARGLIAEPDALSPEVALELATRFEGHPDNAAPAIYGGAVVAWQDERGPHASPLTVAPGIETTVLIPESTLPTSQARSVLPARVPHKDAAFNVSRAALLVNALAGRPQDLLAATEDRLHQDYRASAMPAAAAMVAHLRGRGLAAVVSGAGPAVLVMGVGLEAEGLGTGPATSLSGVGGEVWRAVHASEPVQGVRVRRL